MFHTNYTQVPSNISFSKVQPDDSQNKPTPCEATFTFLNHVATSAKVAFEKMPQTLSVDSDDEGEGAENAKAPKEKKADKKEKNENSEKPKKEKFKKKFTKDTDPQAAEEQKVGDEETVKGKERAESESIEEEKATKDKKVKKEKNKSSKRKQPINPPPQTLTLEIQKPVDVSLVPLLDPIIEKESTELVELPKEKKKDEPKLKKIKQPFGLKHRAWLAAGMTAIIFFCVISRNQPALISALTPGLMDYLRVAYKCLDKDGYEKLIVRAIAAISLVLAFAASFTDENSLMNALPFFAVFVAIAIKSELNKAKPEKKIADFFDPSNRGAALPETNAALPETNGEVYTKFQAFKQRLTVLVDQAKVKIAPEGITKHKAKAIWSGSQMMISSIFITNNWAPNVQAVSGTIFKSNMRGYVNDYFKQITQTANDIVRRTTLGAQYVLLPLMGGLSFYALRENMVTNIFAVGGLTITSTLGLDTLTRLLKGFLWEFAEFMKYGNLTEADLKKKKADKAEKGQKENEIDEHTLRDHFVQFFTKCPRGAAMLALVFGASYPLNQLMLKGTLPQAVIATLANEMVVLFKPLTKGFAGTNMSLIMIVPSIILFAFGLKNEAALAILPSLLLYLGKDKIRPKSDLDAMQEALNKMKDLMSEKQFSKLNLELAVKKAEESHIF